MELIKRMDRFMLGEAKTKVSPLLNSIYKKQDNIDKAGAEGLVKALDKLGETDTAFTVSHGLPIGKSNAQIVIKRGDEDYTSSTSAVKKVLQGNGFTVISDGKSDGKTWTVKFKK